MVFTKPGARWHDRRIGSIAAEPKSRTGLLTSLVAHFTRGMVVAMVLGCSAMTAWVPSVSMSVRLTANALIMDATTFPWPSPGYMDSAITDFIAPSTGTDPADYTPIAVWQPSRVLGINGSVDGGVESLLDALEGQTGEVVVFGFSQSTVTQVRVRAELQARKDRGETVPDVTFVGIGVGNRPNGGISSRFEGVTIPFFDYTFDGPQPNGDTDFEFIDIARQYDGLADLPQFPVNLVSTANAVLGVVFVHLLYGEEVSLDPSSPKYVEGTVKETIGNTTYYFIPTADLPLLDPFRLIGVPEQALDIVEPFLKVLVEAGYDRSVSFGEPTPAQLIPVIDPATLIIQLAKAVVEGANNAAAIVGAQLPGYDTLTAQLNSAEQWAASTIGEPYRHVVRTINDAFNPFQAFAALTGPPARYLDSVLNPLIVRALSAVVDPVIAAATGWVERNILFPQGQPGPVAGAVIDLLRRVAPNLATGTTEETTAAFADRAETSPPVDAGSDDPALDRHAGAATPGLLADSAQASTPPQSDVLDPDLTNSGESVESPRGVESHGAVGAPGGVEPPGEVVKSPRGVVESLREVVKSPREVVESLREVVKSPRGVLKSPDRPGVRRNSGDTPSSVRRDLGSPRDDERNASPVERAPGPSEASDRPQTRTDGGADDRTESTA